MNTILYSISINGEQSNHLPLGLLSTLQTRRWLLCLSLQSQKKRRRTHLCSQKSILHLTQIRMTRIKDKDRDNALNEVRILASQKG